MEFNDLDNLKDGDILTTDGETEFLFERKYSKRYGIGTQSGNYMELTNLKTDESLVLNWTNRHIVKSLQLKKRTKQTNLLDFMGVA